MISLEGQTSEDPNVMQGACSEHRLLYFCAHASGAAGCLPTKTLMKINSSLIQLAIRSAIFSLLMDGNMLHTVLTAPAFYCSPAEGQL